MQKSARAVPTLLVEAKQIGERQAMAISDTPSTSAPNPALKPRSSPTNPGFYARTLVSGEHVTKTLAVKIDAGSECVLFCHETSLGLHRLCSRTKTLREICNHRLFTHLLDVAKIESPSGVDNLIVLAENSAVTFLMYDLERKIFRRNGNYLALCDHGASAVEAPRTLEVHPTRPFAVAAPLQGAIYIFPVMFFEDEVSAGRIRSYEFKGILLSHAWLEGGMGIGDPCILALLIQCDGLQFIELLAVSRDSLDLICVVSTCSMRQGEVAVSKAAVQLLGHPPLRPSKACTIHRIPDVPYGIVICLEGRLIVSNVQDMVHAWSRNRSSTPIGYPNAAAGNGAHHFGVHGIDESPQDDPMVSPAGPLPVTTPPFIGFGLESSAKVIKMIPCGSHLESAKGLYVALSNDDLGILRYSVDTRGLQVQFTNHALEMQYQLEFVANVGRVISMAALDNNLLLISFDAADGGLWHITSKADGKENPVVLASGQTSYNMNLQQSFLNLSPITDITIMNSPVFSKEAGTPRILDEDSSKPESEIQHENYGENQGEAKIVVCTGMGQQGMLRIMSKGAPVFDYSDSEAVFRNCNQIWNIKPSFGSRYDLFSVLSFPNATGVLLPIPAENESDRRNDSSGSTGLKAFFVDGSEASGLVLDKTTHAVGLISDGVIAQIHSNGVRLLKLKRVTHKSCVVKEEEGRVVSTIADDVKDYHVEEGGVVSLGAVGRNIIVYCPRAAGQGAGIRVIRFHDFDRFTAPGHQEWLSIQKQISCIRVIDGETGWYVVFGTYDKTLDLIFIPYGSKKEPIVMLTTEKIRCQINHVFAIPESILVIDHDGEHWIIVGMRNGFLRDYKMPFHMPSWSEYSHLESLSSHQLGAQPIRLCPITTRDGLGILASAERLWLGRIYNDRICWMPLAFSWARAVAPLSLPGAERCMTVIDNNDALRVCGVRRIVPVSVQSIPVGGTPHRATCLRLDSEKSDFVVVAVTVNEGSSQSSYENVTSELRVYDCRNAQLKVRRRLKDDETVHVLQRYKDYILVGTAFKMRDFRLRGIPCRKGRLLLLSLVEHGDGDDVTGEKFGDHESDYDDYSGQYLEFYLCSEITFAGAVLAAATFGEQERLLVSCNEAIVIFKLEQRCALVELARASTRMLVVAISCYGSLICVADRKDSLGFYHFNEGEAKLERNQGDFRKRIASDCAALNEHMAIAPDKLGNLFSLSHERCAQHDTDRSEGDRYGKVVSNHTFGLGSVSTRICYGVMRRHDFVESFSADVSSGKHNVSQASTVKHRQISTEKDIALGTLTGSVITLVPAIAKDLAILSSVEKAMECHVRTQPPVYGSTHKDFRSAYGSASKGIVDGDFLEQFIKLDKTSQLEIVASAGYPGYEMVDQVVKLLFKFDNRVY